MTRGLATTAATAAGSAAANCGQAVPTSTAFASAAAASGLLAWSRCGKATRALPAACGS